MFYNFQFPDSEKKYSDFIFPDIPQDWPPFLLLVILHFLNLLLPFLPISFRILLFSKYGHYPWFNSLLFISSLFPFTHLLQSFILYYHPTSDGSDLYFYPFKSFRHLFLLPDEYHYVYIHLYVKFSTIS